MEFEIEFTEGAGPADVEIALLGEATLEEFRRFNEILAADPRFRAGLAMLVDVSALDTSALSEQSLAGMSEPIVERDWHHPPAAVAIIAAGERTVGAARTYRAHLGGSRSNREIFETRGQALAWLEQQNRP